MSEADEERAGELGSILLEVLRLLNKSEAEGTEVSGLEHRELLTLLRRGIHPEANKEELDLAIETLMGNRMISELDDDEFAWDRGRTPVRAGPPRQGIPPRTTRKDRSDRVGPPRIGPAPSAFMYPNGALYFAWPPTRPRPTRSGRRWSPSFNN